jgi:hypothetical protein
MNRYCVIAVLSALLSGVTQLHGQSPDEPPLLVQATLPAPLAAPEIGKSKPVAEAPVPKKSSDACPLPSCQTVATSRSDQSAVSGRFWVDGDVLLWWMRRANLPPLVTGSPAGTAGAAVGVPGLPGTAVLFGGTPVNGEGRVGGRVTAGLWLDCDHTCGVEAYFFQLCNQTQRFSGGTPGSVGRPFIDASTGTPNAELVSLAGFLDGNLQASASTPGLIGTGALGRCNLCCGCDCCGNQSYRLDALAGYRYLSLSDRVGIAENLTSTDPAQRRAPLGTNILVTDSFHSHNQFHGADFGLTGEFRRNAWSLSGMVRIALGATLERVDINGTTIVTVPGFPPVVNSGGLLALSSNSGTHSRSPFAVVPEARVQLAYQATERVRVHVGYTFLYWSQVARAGDQIDLVVNPALLPPPVPGASPLRPAFNFHGTGFWGQGIDLGLEFRF